MEEDRLEKQYHNVMCHDAGAQGRAIRGKQRMIIQFEIRLLVAIIGRHVHAYISSVLRVHRRVGAGSRISYTLQGVTEKSNKTNTQIVLMLFKS